MLLWRNRIPVCYLKYIVCILNGEVSCHWSLWVSVIWKLGERSEAYHYNTCSRFLTWGYAHWIREYQHLLQSEIGKSCKIWRRELAKATPLHLQTCPVYTMISAVNLQFMYFAFLQVQQHYMQVIWAWQVTVLNMFKNFFQYHTLLYLYLDLLRYLPLLYETDIDK